MKKYEKPTLEVVKIKVREDFAEGNNTTIYNLGDTVSAPTQDHLDIDGGLS